ncbi:unnamed protein product [Cunninghamella blakesleeana]
MAKSVTRNPSVVKIISSALIDNNHNDYIVGESEWPNGCRSDLVLEPKALLGLPPIIIEFQQSVNKVFLKRVIQYSLQAYNRYQVDPIVLIVCLKTFQQSHPFAAFGLFLTQSTSIKDFICDDSTIKHLKELALDHYNSLVGNQVSLAEFVKEICYTQEKQYDHFLTLFSQQSSSQVIKEAIQAAQIEQRKLKKKFEEAEEAEVVEEVVEAVEEDTAIHPSPHPNQPSTSTNNYKNGMLFVLEFKKARIDQGKTRMDWKQCMKEGREKGLLLQYKNTDTLKNQFKKYEKSQVRE